MFVSVKSVGIHAYHEGGGLGEMDAWLAVMLAWNDPAMAHVTFRPGVQSDASVGCTKHPPPQTWNHRLQYSAKAPWLTASHLPCVCLVQSFVSSFFQQGTQ